ncbi:MAG: recombination mediator RecR [Planctomycetota bacterium]|nr:recombination mediator RecR [Planctomycetota bacterium]MEC8251235.1 recombination mediator RecR [Planctomycetota bacterium]MEC8412651.1 recombination mediator RecR [Planctomycetota bacterium]MEC8770130.1 recombination mediator RecR [Planctomycetota bacterium]MED5322359.1 recombination mediator RecR [Planctomycetota bacterium]
MSAGGPPTLEALVDRLGQLPGIGRRSAERLAFWLLRASSDEALGLAEAIRAVKEDLVSCRVCGHLGESDLCAICSDSRRDAGVILVVEEIKDLVRFESAGLHQGVYHVLGGAMDPLSGVGPEHLGVDGLIRRCRDATCNLRGEPVREVVLGLNPTLDGDTTALHLAKQIEPFDIRVTRLARGLPSGGTLEQASVSVLADAMDDRRPLGGEAP